MKRIMTMMMILAAVAFVSGCLTRGSAYTKKTLPDGTVTESRASIIGIGDKAAEVAANGLFADGNDDDLGAGFKDASAKQQSTGIDGTLTGLGTLMQGMATFMASSQGLKTAGAATSAAASASPPASAAASSQTASASANCVDGNCATPAAANCVDGKCSTP